MELDEILELEAEVNEDIQFFFENQKFHLENPQSTMRDMHFYQNKILELINYIKENGK